MNNSFKKCIERNKIVKLENAETLVLKELELAEEDLGFAKLIISRLSSRTYTMFTTQITLICKFDFYM